MLAFSQKVALYSNHVIVKDSGSTKLTPWHQDQAYYEIDGHQACIVPKYLFVCLLMLFFETSLNVLFH